MAHEPFIRIPAQVVEMGIVRGLTRCDMKLLLCLSYHASWRTGKCWPSWKLLSQEAQVGKNQLFKSLQHLKDLGLISIQKDGRRNTYQLFRTLQAPPGTVTVEREQSPRKLKRDEKGRIVTVNGERAVTVNRELIVTAGEDSNERIERAIGTRKSNPPIFVISKETRQEYEALWGKEKLEAYMRERGYVVDPAEEKPSPKGEGD